MLLAAAVLSLLFASGWEYSLRRYLDGFSDAIVPDAYAPEQKVEVILTWMRGGPQHQVAARPEELANRDPETTLNYQQLLSICGTATNAFLNLAKSSGLQARRLLLLDANRRAKHVVAEALMGERWVVVDPAYRVILRDAAGRALTRAELQDPLIFQQATRAIANYLPEYNFQQVAHVRVERLPLVGFRLRRILDSIYSRWEEVLDWGLILERESFAMLFASASLAGLFLLLRGFLAWYADRRLGVPRFRLREHFLRAGAALFTSPEIK